MTYEVLGYFYDFDKTNIEDNLKAGFATTDTMTTFTLEPSSHGARQPEPPQAVMTALPEMRLVIDAKEQRIQRPKNIKDGDGLILDNQRPYLSGQEEGSTSRTKWRCDWMA